MNAKDMMNFLNKQPTEAAGDGRICTGCGAAIEPGDRFCERCGTPVPASAPVPTPAPVPVHEPEPVESPFVVAAAPAEEAPAAGDPFSAAAAAPAEPLASEQSPFAPSDAAPIYVRQVEPMAPAPEESAVPFRSPAQEAPTTVVVQYVEKAPVFAAGLPEWSLEPPMVAVRRKGTL